MTTDKAAFPEAATPLVIIQFGIDYSVVVAAAATEIGRVQGARGITIRSRRPHSQLRDPHRRVCTRGAKTNMTLTSVPTSTATKSGRSRAEKHILKKMI